MIVNNRANIFLGIGFLLGAINLLYSQLFYIFLLLAFVVNLWKDWNVFRYNVLKEWRYLILPLVGVLYLVVHYLISLFWGITYKPSWSMVEYLLLYFFVLPLYLLSVKPFLTSHLLKRFLIMLCLGILLINFIKFFYLTGWQIFVEPILTLKEIYAGRFGFNMGFWGGYFYLESQACYLSICSLLNVYFLLIEIGGKKRIILYWVILIFSLLFLSFTVTKGAILGFLLGIIVLVIIIWRRLSKIRRIVFSTVFTITLVIATMTLSGVYHSRYKELTNEIKAMQEGKLLIGSFSGRIIILQRNLEHLDQFGIWGLGVYKKNIRKEWYKGLDVTHAHNSFIEFWVSGGLLGMIYIFYYFVAPILKMRRLKQFSAIVFTIIIALGLMNCTTILIILVDSSPFVISLLALLFFYTDKFYELETSRGADVLVNCNYLHKFE